MELPDDIMEEIERALDKHLRAGFIAGVKTERARTRLLGALAARESSLLELGKDMYSAGLQNGRNQATSAPATAVSQPVADPKAQQARTRLGADLEQNLNRKRVTSLHIGTRAKRVLTEAGITTVNKLRRKTISELLRMSGLGPRSVEGIVDELKHLGVALDT